MNFKEYDNFISESQTKQLIQFAHDCYLKDENHIDLGHMCDKIMLNAPLILYGDLKKWDLLEVIEND